ncbi:MAG: hypothetical protein KGZ61_12225 [Sandarakinorhabdus sp.]|nr:hypothetical protein [Sandarakinorhabdus sp.]
MSAQPARKERELPKARIATRAAVSRAVKSYEAAIGAKPQVIELAPDGTIRLSPAPIAAPRDAFEEWQDRL